ncbi:hypothetical protein GBAR_LOCUS17598 [Geodia barretti]|uniref:Uncharacterized protein n=1 Tax=Geodia barretti TaxID=519541 RepID=A0AA35SK42_GEOBA|nr:hypothetical protein GBAR_LOCUS17598 [Geodia barretti]
MTPASRAAPERITFPPVRARGGRREAASAAGPDREPVALDLREELRAQPLRLVTPDAGKDAIARSGQIAFQKGVGEGPHRELRTCHIAPDLSLVADHADGGHQGVAAAPQPFQLPPRVLHIHRLVEPLIAADEELVGADDEGAGRAGADPAGLE